MKKKGVEKVAIIKCRSYRQKEVDKAIKRALKFLEFDTKKWKRVLIKPNVLGYYEKNLEAIITHPSIVKALIKIFKGRQLIGESSFMDTKKSFEKTGYQFKGKKIFEQEKLVKVKDDKAKILKEFYLPEILKQIDLLINVPKLKTHTLTKITGAIKNLYGCIPGGLKQVLHKKATGGENFSSLLVDIYQNLKPQLNIMDAVVGMEGEGPSAGKSKKVGLILASKNAVALDIVASKIIGYSPSEIWMIKEAVNRKLYPGLKVKIVGDFKKIPNLKFEKPAPEKRTLVRAVLRKLVRENPILVNKERCVKCGICARKCPVKAIKLNPYPEINKKKCIRCFCCIEVCPQHALYLKEIPVRRLIKKIRERKKPKA
ncbi:hypothetical protein DRN69_07345 [Candidatus Pacearchaeota archaeon]|nr:MAG: hypothetical protein DRN69_07345 [Candidatus Pacearchaeota archaeon]